MTEWSFLHPEWLLALVLLPWLPAALPAARLNTSLRKVMHPALLRLFTLSGTRGHQSPSTRWIVRLAGALSIIALAGPSLPISTDPIRLAPKPLIIALDLSLSMYAEDIAPSRIERARQKIQDILHRNPDRPVGLIVWAGEAFGVVPITADHEAIRLMLPDLSPAIMPAPGSHPERAVRLARQWITPDDTADLLIISDDMPESVQAAFAQSLSQWPGRVGFLATGTPAGAPIPLPGNGFLSQNDEVILARLPEDRLNALATAQSFRWHPVSVSDADINALLGSADTTRTREAAQAGRPPANLGYLLIPFIMLLTLWLWPRLIASAMIFTLFALPAPGPAQALELDAAFKNRNQRAWEAFERGDFKRAATLAQSPALKGAALYRAGDFSGAAQVWSADTTAIGHYNRGNALAQAGQFKAAREAWQTALGLDPSLQQARRNIEWLDNHMRETPSGSSGTHQPTPDNATHRRQQPDRSAAQQNNDNTGSVRPDASETHANSPPPKAPVSGPQNKTAVSPDTPTETGSNAENPAQSPKQSQPVSGFSDDDAEIWLRRIPDNPGTLLRRKFELHLKERGYSPQQGEPVW